MKKIVIFYNIFSCKVETASIVADDDEYVKQHIQDKPEIKVVIYTSSIENEINSVLQSMLDEATKNDAEQEKLKREMKEKMLQMTENSQNNNKVFSNENESPFKTIKRECSDLDNILKDLGLWSFSIALQDAIEKYKKNDSISSKNVTEMKNFGEQLEDLFKQVRLKISQEEEENLENILIFSSEKLNCLLDIYNENNKKSNFHSIVFVERKSTAKYIDIVFKKLSQIEKWSFIKSDHLFGVSGVRNNMTIAKQAFKIIFFLPFLTLLF